MADIASDDRLLLMNEVSERTRIPIDSLRYMRLTGDGPPSFRLGRRVVYPESGLRAWIRGQAEREAVERAGRAAPLAGTRRRRGTARPAHT